MRFQQEIKKQCDPCQGHGHPPQRKHPLPGKPRPCRHGAGGACRSHGGRRRRGLGGDTVNQASPGPHSPPRPLSAPLGMVGATGGVGAGQALPPVEIRAPPGQALLPWEPPDPAGTQARPATRPAALTWDGRHFPVPSPLCHTRNSLGA